MPSSATTGAGLVRIGRSRVHAGTHGEILNGLDQSLDGSGGIDPPGRGKKGGMARSWNDLELVEDEGFADEVGLDGRNCSIVSAGRYFEFRDQRGRLRGLSKEPNRESALSMAGRSRGQDLLVSGPSAALTRGSDDG